MKKNALSFMIISNALCSGFVCAGDIGPANLPQDVWTGFYIGANAGGAWNKIEAKTRTARNGDYFLPEDQPKIAAAGSQGGRKSAFIGGGQIGYNYRMNNFVIGLEAEIDSLKIHRSKSVTANYGSTPEFTFTITTHTKTDWLFTLKPKLGYATESWFLYGTGGLAVSKVKHNFHFTDDFFTGALEHVSVSQKNGWTAGGGLEFKFSPCWSIRGEYLYADFGQVRKSGVVNTLESEPPLPTLAHRAGLISQNATIGINYKFT